MIELGKAVQQSTEKPAPPMPAAPKLIAGAMFGLAFGFLLQKGGAGNFHVLLGQLLLQDWTAAKIMLSAIVVGMIGIFTLHHFAKVNLHIKPTRIGSNIIGGLIFGAGFALTGYCPGTAAAAVGQGSWDALFGIAGLIAGSWMFAELSGWTKRTIENWGDLGKVLLPDLLHVPRGVFVGGFAVALTALLVVLQRFTTR
jgi:F0F1-type ATP synthase assembly protein I